ncbi:nuclear transport factor 2 family protein [Rhizohabitans arisaemae]|uniref:nuclear transport factor 2 family protein n=1 Tax=Rhizohabitans arisaemae TaxID=2720610 RepID=UPI0024B03C98|nr:nuclear transport factor 2 family protein [Rhizohabitans arisaemae]
MRPAKSGVADLATAYEVLWRMTGARLEGPSLAIPVADDCLFVLPGASVRGFDKAHAYFAAYLGVYPDTVKRVQHVLRDDTTVVLRSVVEGHNTGQLVTAGDMAEPTGLEVQWDIVEWLVLKGGEIIEWRTYQEPTPYLDALNARRAVQMGISIDEASCVPRVARAAAAGTVRLDGPLDEAPRPVGKRRG